MVIAFIIALLPVILGQVATAPAPAPTMVPNPSPDLSGVMFMQGTWTCHGLVRGKDRPDTSTGAVGMNGRWLVVHDVAPPFDPYRTSAINSDTYYTYDPQNKQYISMGVDDFGGYTMATSPGWKGNTMVWTDKSSPDGTVAVTTLTKVSDGEFSVKNTGTDPKGKALPVFTSTCKKS